MSAPAPTAAPPVSTQRMIGVLGTVALVSGLLVVTAYELTLPQIEENRRIAIERAIATVYPEAKTRRAYRVTPERLALTTEAVPSGQVIYAVFDSGGKFLGVAAQAAARGYQDVVRLLYAYSPECQCITAIHVLANRDTPGIGDKIAKDRQFLENFRALDVRLAPDGRTLANPIVTVKHGTKVEAWQIDAISGATITSKAVGKALNDSAQTVVPRVTAELQVIAHPEIRP